MITSSATPATTTPPPTSALSGVGLSSPQLVSIGGVGQAAVPAGHHYVIHPQHLREGRGSYSAFLNTTGRVLREVFVYPNNLVLSIFIVPTIPENSLPRLPSDPSITSGFTSAASTF